MASRKSIARIAFIAVLVIATTYIFVTPYSRIAGIRIGGTITPPPADFTAAFKRTIASRPVAFRRSWQVCPWCPSKGGQPRAVHRTPVVRSRRQRAAEPNTRRPVVRSDEHDRGDREDRAKRDARLPRLYPPWCRSSPLAVGMWCRRLVGSTRAVFYTTAAFGR